MIMSKADAASRSDLGSRRPTHPGAILRRPALVVYVAVGSLAAIGWTYLAAMVAAMVPAMDMAELGPGMQVFNAFNLFSGLSPELRAALAALCLPTSATSFGMPAASGWGALDLALVFVMWVMMVLAMMLPTAAPMLAAVAGRAEAAGARSAVPTLGAALGYLTVWSAFAAIATLAQWGLTAAGAVSPMMAPATTVFAGTVLVAAGIYQFTPAKRACLRRCRRPVRLAGGRTGGFRVGLEHGVLCFGCCWALMAVMFATGIMNVLWIAVLSIVMVVERTVFTDGIPYVIGMSLLVWGMTVLAVGAPGQALLTG